MIIALSGKIGSGKDTAGEILIDEHGFIRVAFGDLLKENLIKYFKVAESDIKTKPPHVRQMLQGLGEFARNEINSRYWIDGIIGLIRYLIYDNKCIVITDLRYLNELTALKELKEPILFIRINTNKNNDDIHISETELDNYNEWDYVFDNNDDLYTFRYKLSEFFTKIMNGYR